MSGYDYNARKVMELREFARSANIAYADVRKEALVSALEAWDAAHAPQVAAYLAPIKHQERTRMTVAPKATKATARSAITSNLSRKRKQSASEVSSNQTTKRPKDTSSKQAAQPEYEKHGAEEGSFDPDNHGEEQTVTRKQPTTTRRPQRAAAKKACGRLNGNTNSSQMAGLNTEKSPSGTMPGESPSAMEAGDIPHTTHNVESSPGTGSRRKYTSKSSTTFKDLNQEAQKKPEAEEKEKERAYHKRLHEARLLGAYTDPEVAKTSRVKHRTIMEPLDDRVRLGVEKAPMNQLSGRRQEERMRAEAETAGREVKLWMGGSSPHPEDDERDKSGRWIVEF
ncbi:hypothetical protein FB567DRAFT_173525 [Paraphoma chrysanthemicola]|uniref:Uncharacterized protein n=1 Tax=Paraphoma chrysanthemicola TaxID=798071 RepID=A0A8K0RFE9_9PLEO|nr:hypothetical protein FB567DRAFT_173525 [Paraphoma chrysanthemicola]